MVKKTITYVDPFTERQVTEDHYFHISKADLVEMEVEEHGAKYTNKDGEALTGMQAHLQRIAESEDGPAVLKEFKAILRRGYGKKVGDRFVKNTETWQEFEGSEAYSELIFQLLTNAGELAKFVSSILPGNLEQIAKEVAARAEAEEAANTGSSVSTPAEGVSEDSSEDPTGLTNPVTPRVLTTAEVGEMDAIELKSGLAEGRYKLS